MGNCSNPKKGKRNIYKPNDELKKGEQIITYNGK